MYDFENRLKQVMADILEVEISDIVVDSSPDTIESWDSLQQLNLVSALEAEFSIALTPDDIADMLSYALVRDIVQERLGA
ncbi:acyl carrier protein [Thalassospira lucentensis]|uniref:acyl carrier protein n=1 Tax=Thalassospira lucentensis TaxID=168935 RepID=UPI003D2EAD19